MDTVKETMADSGYLKYIRHKKLVILSLFILCILVALFALCSGSSGLNLIDVANCFLGRGDKMSNSIVFNIRLPRIVTAMVVGILLAMAGSVMQSVLRNPLASSSTLGISQGASFGATVGIICFGAGLQGTSSSASAITIYNPTVVVI